jgi:hypothetical protein
MTHRLILAALLLAGIVQVASAAEEEAPTGYTDTPLLPGSKWHVHDGNRPHPQAVAPGSFSTDQQAGKPPSDAVILFDGKSLNAWQDEKGGPARWTVENGYMEVKAGAGNIATRQKFSDYQLHVEFWEPTPAKGHSQERGNSGVFLAGLYEVQVLDGYDNVTYADGQVSALYGQSPPLVNAARPPGHWQTYDILFTTPRFTGGKVSKAGYVTVLLNGVVTQDHTELLGPTVHHALPKWIAHEPDMPIVLQDHTMPIRFRNIWVRPLVHAN